MGERARESYRSVYGELPVHGGYGQSPEGGWVWEAWIEGDSFYRAGRERSERAARRYLFRALRGADRAARKAASSASDVRTVVFENCRVSDDG